MRDDDLAACAHMGQRMGQQEARMTYEEAMARLVVLAKEHNGTLTAAQVEADETLAADRPIVSAAARALDGSTNVFSYEEVDDPREWFPFSGLVFKLQASDV